MSSLINQKKWELNFVRGFFNVYGHVYEMIYLQEINFSKKMQTYPASEFENISKDNEVDYSNIIPIY